jgi:hypothetical protein
LIVPLAELLALLTTRNPPLGSIEMMSGKTKLRSKTAAKARRNRTAHEAFMLGGISGP